MKKKIVIFAMLATTMILAVSMASAINTADIKKEKKESPLFGIRTNRAISEKIQKLKTKFLGERLFFLPFQLFKNNNLNLRDRLNQKHTDGSIDTECGMPTGECSGVPCKTEFTYPTCGTVDCGCTIRATILCGQCTQGIICRTLDGNC